MTWTVIAALAVGMLLGFVLPSFIQLWRISQFAYASGFNAAKFVIRVHLRRAIRALDCKHIPVPPAEDGTRPACRPCVRRALKSLVEALEDRTVDGA